MAAEEGGQKSERAKEEGKGEHQFMNAKLTVDYFFLKLNMYTEESPQAAITSSAGTYLAENPSLSEFTSASGSIHPRHYSA